MLTERSARVRGMAILASIALMLSATSARVAGHDAVGGADPLSLGEQAYASEYGLALDAARAQLRLMDEAGAYQEMLAQKFPDEFAGLWVEHHPSFSVVAAVTNTALAAQVVSIASDDLAAVVVVREHAVSLRKLELAAEEAGDSISTPHNLNIDVRQNQVVIDVLPQALAVATEAIDRHRNWIVRASTKVTEVPTLGGPVADIYGGLNLNGSLSGTSGFSVRRNGTTTDGIVTAGHLSNQLSYNGTALTYQYGIVGGSVDAQWHTTPGLTDAPKFYFGGGTSFVSGTKHYSQMVVGSSVCKWGRTTGYDCGVIESKTFQPSWVPNAQPVFVLVNDCGNDISSGGDSGGPVFWGSTAYGIVQGEVWGGVGCWADKLVFNSATHFGSQLGIHIKSQ